MVYRFTYEKWVDVPWIFHGYVSHNQMVGQSYCSRVMFETLTLGVFQSWFKDDSEAEAAPMPNGSQVTLGAGQNRIPFISK